MFQEWVTSAEHYRVTSGEQRSLAGNVRQRVHHGCAGHPDVRDRELEFSTDNGLDGENLTQTLGQTIAEATEIIRGLSAADLAARSVFQPEQFTKLEALLQVMSHMSQHNGQIIFVTKAMLGPGFTLAATPGR